MLPEPGSGDPARGSHSSAVHQSRARPPPAFAAFFMCVLVMGAKISHTPALDSDSPCHTAGIMSVYHPVSYILFKREYTLLLLVI